MPGLLHALTALGDLGGLDVAEREALLVWAAGVNDVPQAVASCPHARWLGALAELLDQRVTWWLFREEIDDTVPERADACRRIAAGEWPKGVLTGDALAALAVDVRSADPDRRRAALDALGEDHDRFVVTELGYASGLRAPDAMLDAAIETLRARLDVGRMSRALSALSLDETEEQRDERYLRDRDADVAELRAMNDREKVAGPMGAAVGRAMRNVSPARRRRRD